MFTGIIQHLGTVSEVVSHPGGRRLTVDAAAWAHRPAAGDSIAVNGVCLTIAEGTAAADGTLIFDVIQQTLAMTTLGGMEQTDQLNLEHAVTPTTVLGGHIVQGHIDCTATVTTVTATDAETRLRFGMEAHNMAAVIDKGSIAVDGVSLTVAAVGDTWFEVALIPTTLDLTTLGSLSVGDSVNIETDYIARTVINWLQRMHPASP